MGPETALGGGGGGDWPDVPEGGGCGVEGGGGGEESGGEDERGGEADDGVAVGGWCELVSRDGGGGLVSGFCLEVAEAAEGSGGVVAADVGRAGVLSNRR